MIFWIFLISGILLVLGGIARVLARKYEPKQPRVSSHVCGCPTDTDEDRPNVCRYRED